MEKPFDWFVSSVISAMYVFATPTFPVLHSIPTLHFERIDRRVPLSIPVRRRANMAQRIFGEKAKRVVQSTTFVSPNRSTGLRPIRSTK